MVARARFDRRCRVAIHRDIDGGDVTQRFLSLLGSPHVPEHARNIAESAPLTSLRMGPSGSSQTENATLRSPVSNRRSGSGPTPKTRDDASIPHTRAMVGGVAAK